MNYGMRCHDICGMADMDTVFDTVQANNIDQIQLALSKSISGYDFSYGHYSAGFGRLIRKKLDERNIHVAVLGCYINPTNPDEDVLEAETMKFIEHLKYARAIGADMVGTETGRASADFAVVPETYTEENYQRLLKTMRRIVPVAEKLGVIVGIEAVHDHTLYSPKMMRRFLEDIDSYNVEAIIDPVNLISAENYERQDEVFEEAFKLYGDRIGVVHMKDFVMEDGQPVFAHVGEGLMHYEPFLRELKKQKPYVAILLEESNTGRYQSDVAYLQNIYEQV